jgi:glycosyltransferase involved in cell wall biosynthesis
MAMQKPVVASIQAMEGIHAISGEELIVAEDAAAFAKQIFSLLDSDKCLVIGQAARKRVLQHYTWPANLSRINTLLQSSIPAKV